MICPLFEMIKLAFPHLFRSENSENKFCLESGCAWWCQSGNKEQCAIKAIAERLLK